MPSILIYGYGNPGRQDDGVGPALVTALEEWLAQETNSKRPKAEGKSEVGGGGEHSKIENRKSKIRIILDANYQLNAEDALAVSKHGQAIFVDAVKDGAEPFSFRPLTPTTTVTFSTHAMPPEAVLALCRELYGKCPDTYLLAIRGHAWEPNAPMTPEATANLAAALAFLKQQLSSMFCFGISFDLSA